MSPDFRVSKEAPKQIRRAFEVIADRAETPAEGRIARTAGIFLSEEVKALPNMVETVNLDKLNAAFRTAAMIANPATLPPGRKGD